MNRFTLGHCLRNPIFARLYAAQTISLLGDALTWVGLALLAFELAGQKSAILLSTALTLRVTAFVLLSPLAGAIADRFDRKKIMVITHVVRMVIVGLLPFITQIWQVYILIFALNVFNAFFTPTYQATIPLVTGQNDYPQAIALSTATYQLLGVLGPGFAGAVAALIGRRQVFFLDALSFLIAAVLIFTLPGQLQVSQQASNARGRTWRDVKDGTIRLFASTSIRYALFMQLVASIAGAQILVNTVGYVQGTLRLGELEYGWVMAAFGIGATVSAVSIGAIGQRFSKTSLVLFGSMMITIVLLPANRSNLPILMILWLLAGVGQNCVNLPTQTLIADRIPTDAQGRVYGAHFAWSHLWWGISYPLAGWLGSNFSEAKFFYGSLIGLTLLFIVQMTLRPRQHNHEHLHYPVSHEHEHIHDEHHQHEHLEAVFIGKPHTHVHQHTDATKHIHRF
jgi:NRE family putative nickel resistance protein-like MFS transporter